MQTLTMVLGDTQSDIEKKTKYYTNLKDTFNFEEEMKDFLSEKSTRLLESCIKLQNMTYATQRKLQDNYPNGQKLEIGSVYRCHNLIGFYYYLLIAYSTKNHRHVCEMEQQLTLFTNKKIDFPLLCGIQPRCYW